jgi:limonene-1,2-epoxide hydrolase
MNSNARALADALGAAIQARNAEQIRAIYAAGVKIWHANTNAAQTGEENANFLARIFAITSELSYRDVRRYDIDGGVVQQHRLTGKFKDGKPLPDLHACMVIKVAEGKIVSIEEYFDSATFAEVWQRLAATTADETRPMSQE